MKTYDYLDEFLQALENQLKEDDKRWGDTWLKRGLKGQELRIFQEFRDYYDQFKHGKMSIPWLKIAGLAMIAWVREQHPEILQNPNDNCENIAL